MSKFKYKFKNNFKDKMKSQEGFTLIELLVIISIIFITASIGAWYFFNTQDSIDLKEYSNNLSQAIDAANEYYEGSNNENITGTFEGFNADIAGNIANDFKWSNQTACTTDSSTNICIIIPSITQTSITLCNYYGDGYFCVRDQNGVKIWGSGSSLNNAITNIDSNNFCSQDQNKIVTQALNDHQCMQ